MNINYLMAFYEVAKYKSMTRASEILFTSPSAISKKIKELEDEMEIKLIIRENNRIILTDEGEELYSIISEDVNYLDQYKFYGQKHYALNVGIYAYYTTFTSKEIFNQLADEFLQIFITYAQDKELMNKLKHGKLDMVTTINPNFRDEFPWILFREYEVVLAISSKRSADTLSKTLYFGTRKTAEIEKMCQTSLKKLGIVSEMEENLSTNLSKFREEMKKGESVFVVRKELIEKEINSGELKVAAVVGKFPVYAYFSENSEERVKQKLKEVYEGVKFGAE